MPYRKIIKNLKDFKNLKPHRNFKIFMKLQYRVVKKLKTAKSMSKSMYIPQKVSEVTIPITNKYGKLKV